MDLARRVIEQHRGRHGTEDPSFADPRAPSRAVRQRVFTEGQEAPQLMYVAFDLFNREFFEDRLALPLILITTPSSPRAWADYIDKDVHGIQSRIRIAVRVFENGDLFALDVLLHELVHAWQAEIAHDREMGYRGHGPKFAAKCNEIGALLGLPPVGVKGRDGLPDCAGWPLCVRPPDYYGPVKQKPERKKREPKPGQKPGPEPGSSWKSFSVEDCIKGLEANGYDVTRQVDAQPDQRVAWRISEFLRVQYDGRELILPIGTGRRALPDVRPSILSATLLEMEQMGMLQLLRQIGSLAYMRDVPDASDGIAVEGRGLLTYIAYMGEG